MEGIHCICYYLSDMLQISFLLQIEEDAVIQVKSQNLENQTVDINHMEQRMMVSKVIIAINSCKLF